ncbi:MAG TPA: hypothetical protein VGP15_10305, partial [Burkholderiales bacterium]|nr:hypothetical protein [Burkholderiales bacterium]
ALVLVVAAAVIHAVWIYLLKRSGGGMLVVWSFATLSAMIYGARSPRPWCGGSVRCPDGKRSRSCSRAQSFTLRTTCSSTEAIER